VGSGGGGGGKNYLQTVNNINGNGNFDLGSTTKWSLFNTTLTSLIPTGSITAGAGSLTTFTATTSGKLAGTYSLSVGGSGAITAGQGFLSDAVTFDLEDQVKVCAFEFSYQAVSGTMNFSGTSANTWAVYLHDGTNWIQPAGVYGMTQSSGVGTCRGTFQTTGATSYRLAVICINATGGAASMLFDSFKLGPQVIVQGTPVTDWVDYTPTTQGFGTPTITQAQWRRVGGDIEIKVKLTTGTTTGVEARVGLPTGVTSASTVPTLAPANGFYLRGAASVSHGGSMLIEPSVTYLTFGPVTTFGSTSSIGLAKENGNAIISSTEILAFTAKVPVQGWSSNVQMSQDTDTREVSARYTNTAGTSIANSGDINMPFATKAYDTHNAWNGTQYVVPVSGRYRVAATAYFTVQTYAVGNQVYSLLYKNGALYGVGSKESVATTSSNPTTVLAQTVDCVAGDTIEIRLNNNRTAGASTLSTVAGSNTVQIERVSGPSVIAANETVAIRCSNTAGTSITNTGSDVNIPFATKAFDTHGAYNTSTGIFTVPVAGKYLISSSINYASSLAWAANNAVGLSIYKNGSRTVQGPILTITGAYTGYAGATASDLIDCVAGDTLEVRSSNTRTAGAATLSTNAGYNHVEIERVGF